MIRSKPCGGTRLNNRFFAVTGAPGAGKTTLLHALADDGYTCLPEAGRAIIEAATQSAEPHPWTDPRAFALRMLTNDQQSYEAALDLEGPVFFDRGIPDIAGYLQLVGHPQNSAVHRAAADLRYNRRVFIALPWQAIYVQDEHRTQTFDEAVKTCAIIAHAWRYYGYDLTPLPFGSVEERVAFVLKVVADTA